MKRLVCGLWAHAVSTGISRATSYTSLRNGNWDDPTIWESIPPGSGEAVDEFHGPGGDIVRSCRFRSPALLPPEGRPVTPSSHPPRGARLLSRADLDNHAGREPRATWCRFRRRAAGFDRRINFGYFPT